MSLPATLADRRREAATRFAAEGVPHRRIEAWHYSDLRSALKSDLIAPQVWDGAIVREGDLADPFAGVEADTLIFANGRYRRDLSSLSGQPGVEIVDLLSEDLPGWVAPRLGARRGTDEAPMADMALVGMTGGVAIRVAAQAQVTKPIHLVFVNKSAAREARQIRLVVVVGENAGLTLLESHVGTGEGALTNLAMEFDLANHARLTHLKIAADAPTDVHVATSFGYLREASLYDLTEVAGSGAFARHETQVTLGAREGLIRMTGFELLDGTQHADITAVVEHAVPDCKSDLVFKNVLAGRSRGVAQGRIVVRQGADGTDSRQNTRALLLSKTAEADAKPELEIHADDVVCGHGAAIGDLEADALFYLRSRGIPESEARALLIEAFLEEAFTRLPEGSAGDAVRAYVLNRLRDLGQTP